MACIPKLADILKYVPFKKEGGREEGGKDTMFPQQFLANYL